MGADKSAPTVDFRWLRLAVCLRQTKRRRVRPAPPGSVAAGPAWADGGPGRLPSGEAMPVESRSAQPVAEAEHHGGTCRGAEASKQCSEGRDTRARRGSLWEPLAPRNGPARPVPRLRMVRY